MILISLGGAASENCPILGITIIAEWEVKGMKNTRVLVKILKMADKRVQAERGHT